MNKYLLSLIVSGSVALCSHAAEANPSSSQAERLPVTLTIREKNQFGTAVVGSNVWIVRRSAGPNPIYTGYISRAGMVIRVLTPEDAKVMFEKNYVKPTEHE